MEMNAPTYLDWQSLSDFRAACEHFEQVGSATHYNVVMPDKTTHVVTRAILDDLASGADAERIMYWPVPRPD